MNQKFAYPLNFRCVARLYAWFASEQIETYFDLQQLDSATHKWCIYRHDKVDTFTFLFLRMFEKLKA